MNCSWVNENFVYPLLKEEIQLIWLQHDEDIEIFPFIWNSQTPHIPWKIVENVLDSFPLAWENTPKIITDIRSPSFVHFKSVLNNIFWIINALFSIFGLHGFKPNRTETDILLKSCKSNCSQHQLTAFCYWFLILF